MSQDRPLAPLAQLQSRTACLIGAKASRRRRSPRSKPAMRNIVKIISGAASAAGVAALAAGEAGPGMTGFSVQRSVAKARKRRKQRRPAFADLAQIGGSAYLDARRSVWGPNRRDPPYDVRRPLTNW